MMQLSGTLRTIAQLDDEAKNFMAIIQKAVWDNTPALKRNTRAMGNN
jgi:hypothetical protein